MARWRFLAAAGGGFAAGVLTLSHFQLTAQAPPPFARETPPLRGLDSNLYQQTAAEFRACCHQAYNLATLRLKEVHDKLGPNDKPAAVVLDLDETVFDNGGFQAMMLRSGLAYDQRLWDRWEADHAAFVELLPGAKEFLQQAATLGVVPVYISNRNEKFRASTVAALTRHGLAPKAEHHLLLATTTSDKSARRKLTEDKYTVLLYLGDNLRDFDDAFRFPKDIGTLDPAQRRERLAERSTAVDTLRSKFGREWIMFPNAAYGEWQKPFTRGEADLEYLKPTTPP